MVLASVASATVEKMTQACPRSLSALQSTTSKTVPNWQNTARKHFFISAS